MKTHDPRMAEKHETAHGLKHLADSCAALTVRIIHHQIKIARLRAALRREKAARIELGRAFDECVRTLDANRAFSADLQKQAANVRAEFKPLAELLQNQKETIAKLKQERDDALKNLSPECSVDPCPRCGRDVRDPQFSHSACMVEAGKEGFAKLGAAMARDFNEAVRAKIEETPSEETPSDLSKLEPVTVGIPADLLKQIPPELIVGDPGEAQRAKDNRS